MVDVDIRTGTVTVNGSAVKLSRIEYAILLALYLNRDRVMSREEIIERVWGRWGSNKYSSLGTGIRRLRGKIGRKMIVTEHGYGYGWRDGDG